MGLQNIFEGNYKKYLIIPAVLFAVFMFLVLVFPGVQQSIDFKGGTLMIIEVSSAFDAEEVETLINENFPVSDLSVTSTIRPGGFGLNIQYIENKIIAQAEGELKLAKSMLESDPAASAVHAANVLDIVSVYAVPDPPRGPLGGADSDMSLMIKTATETLADAKENFGIQMQQLISETFSLPKELLFQKKEIGATLGTAFWETAVFVAIVAFILVMLVIFIFFREIIPSFAVIAAAVFDVAGALALMALFGIQLSLYSIPALLMLVGYSVDTDIMLTTRLLKRKDGSPSERTYTSMKTGLTMTLTTIAAVSVMLVLSYVNQISVIFEIAAVLLFGLIADLISTWFMNAPVLLWYVERIKKKRRY